MPGLSLEEINALRTQRTQLAETGQLSVLCFPVEKIPLTDLQIEGTDTVLNSTDFCAIVRTDSNKIIGVHGPNYGLVENKELYRVTTEILREVFPHAPLTYTDEAYNSGACGRRDIQIRVESEDEWSTHPQYLTIYNSYNGLWPMQAMFTSKAMRFNGETYYFIVPPTTSVYGKHTSGLNEVKIRRTINQAYTNYVDFFNSNNFTENNLDRLLLSLPTEQDRERADQILTTFLATTDSTPLIAKYHAYCYTIYTSPILPRFRDNAYRIQFQRLLSAQKAVRILA